MQSNRVPWSSKSSYLRIERFFNIDLRFLIEKRVSGLGVYDLDAFYHDVMNYRYYGYKSNSTESVFPLLLCRVLVIFINTIIVYMIV